MYIKKTLHSDFAFLVGLWEVEVTCAKKPLDIRYEISSEPGSLHLSSGI